MKRHNLGKEIGIEIDKEIDKEISGEKPVFKAIPEYTGVSKTQFFEEIVPQQKPVVIRGFSESWPVVHAAKQSNKAFIDYLNTFYTGTKTAMVVAPPAENKRFFYDDTLSGVNFISGEERVDLFLGRLLELVDREVYPAISMQGTPTNTILPGFAEANCASFFSDITPGLWIGNETIINTHYDGSDNLATVIAGERQFILFPPEQTENLYPGPINFTPAGAPTSLVDINAPDLERFPRFEKALTAAYSAELKAGDAIFIPMLWWHHVESKAKVNGLINYWWNGASAPNAISPSPIDSLNLALLAMHDLTPKQRHAWRCLFDHYLFRQGVEPSSYIPEHQLHMLGSLTPEYIDQVKQYFVNKLQK
jgi:hypothetical protein